MKKGFTLLELLVTISIIGILLAMGSVSYTTAQKKGREARRRSDISAIQKSLEECFSLDGSYPLSITVNNQLTCPGGTVTMNQVPGDPKPSYVYTYTRTGSPATAYCLCALLEFPGTGNAGANCSYTVGGNYACVSNQQ